MARSMHGVEGITDACEAFLASSAADKRHSKGDCANCTDARQQAEKRLFILRWVGLLSCDGGDW